MLIPDGFRLKNCIYLFSMQTGQHICFLLALFSVPIDKICRENAENFWKCENLETFFIIGVNMMHFHSEHCNYLFIKDHWTTKPFLVDPLNHFNPRCLSKLQQKNHKNFENWKNFSFLSISVLICDILQKPAINSSEKPT